MEKETCFPDDQLTMSITVMAEQCISLMEVCAKLGFDCDVVRDKLWRKKTLCAFVEELRSGYLNIRLGEMNRILDTGQSMDRTWLKCATIMWAAEKILPMEVR